MRSLFIALALGVSAVALAACGGSSGGGSASGAAPTPSSVQGCLQKAGYGVAQVPASEVASGGAENRGPGQTGELWVGLGGKTPGSADEAAGVVAFWDSQAHATRSPNARDAQITRHADAVGAVTVQPGSALLVSITKSHQVHNRSEAVAALKSDLGKIENCVR